MNDSPNSNPFYNQPLPYFLPTCTNKDTEQANSSSMKSVEEKTGMWRYCLNMNKSLLGQQLSSSPEEANRATEMSDNFLAVNLDRRTLDCFGAFGASISSNSQKWSTLWKPTVLLGVLKAK
ncbi:hypothetical protein MIMGU_mgv1a016477mg [Erythranthe guttata]|uniref:Uncharacterized protein n=1 Tax=Erythranthe guttata TaxID=4155 RepID=A0A022QGR1_ERYGU|nr:hypothetical protein MIMGU_mgv1a016477mg [Erythranthe guttata]